MVSPLELLCALLRRSLAPDRPVELGGAAVDWPALVRLATGHLVAPAITDKALGHLPASAERDAVAGLLGDIRRANARRNAGALRQVEAIALALGGHGIRPVLLKGTARLVEGLYPTPAMRHIQDIDLLIPAGRLLDAARILQELGYRHGRSAATFPAEHHHLPVLRPTGGGLPVELHSRLMATVHEPLLPPAQAWASAQPIRVGAGHAAVLAPADALMHIIGHEQLNHQSYLMGHLGLRSAIETMMMVDRDRELSVEVLARAERAGVLRPFASMLLLGAWVMDQPCPLPTGYDYWLSRAMVVRARWQHDRPWARTVSSGLGALLVTSERLRQLPHHRRSLPRRLLQGTTYINYLRHLRQSTGPFRMH